MRRVVVIGGVAAGAAAAVRAARSGLASSVTMVDAGSRIAYGVCELPQLVSGEIVDSNQLVPHDEAGFESRFGVKTLTGWRAEAIDTRSRRIGLRDRRGRELDLAYDGLVIATGAQPTRPAVGAARVLRTIADGEAIANAARVARGGRAAVLGAGYIGLEIAEALVQRDLQVAVFDRERAPLAGLEARERAWMLQQMERAGVLFCGGTAIDSGVVDGADLVVAALGVRPEVELARTAGIGIGDLGGIVVDERGQTSVGDVYAAGDCCQVRHLVSGRQSLMPLASVANRAGRVAGLNAAGGRGTFRGASGALVFRAFGLEVGRVGLTSEQASSVGFDATVTSIESTSHAAPLPGAAPILVSLVIDRPSGRVLGGSVVGPAGAALRLQVLATQVAAGATVEALAELDLGYAPVVSPLVDPVVRAARVAASLRRGSG